MTPACTALLPVPPCLVQVKKVDELRGDISRLELSLGSAKAEYDKLKAANLSETARFAAERRAEYLQMMENFTATQVGERQPPWGGARGLAEQAAVRLPFCQKSMLQACCAAASCLAMT